ncbi:carboxypeptidase-like regulatory domain-containing protein [Thalassoglobus polymorphus]|uniref:Carboxypeptidase regulatory-like domain-containing protein n=1 Tax=Thalassoglobus polymorphus TaxID=2527994 RepID=A0A517QL28_9PLAN|nr:carboxypeptidase-like regulatory domain-containing protein [Thalassoglobus polymorphus]QDT32338.1 hypothetical protein Mal48_15820 [Thalassoglobus polymorphus]
MLGNFPSRELLVSSCLFLLVGCGGSPDTGPELVDAGGTVKLSGEPLAHADLYFMPAAGTSGIGGTARSDESGNFTVNYGRGGTGLPAGNYVVTVSQRLMPDGTPVAVDDDRDPIESPAKEQLPEKYSNAEKSKVQAVVQPGQAIQIDLE